MKISEGISLLFSAAALCVAWVALQTGANERKQDAEITTLDTAIHRLTQGLDNQLVTNGVLVNSFNVQLRTDGVLDSSLNFNKAK
jgi:hypothetical protein